jgi:hypothetical protein
VGFERNLNETTSIGGSYTYFQGHDADSLASPGGDLTSLVLQPNTSSTTFPFSSATAALDINFQRADIDYRSVLCCGQTYSITLVSGLSYAHLQQDFSSVFVAPGVNTASVTSSGSFDGGGIHVGLDLEKHACNSGFMVYGRGGATLLGGEFEESFVQNSTAFGSEVNTSWKAGRVVTILDLESGFGWANCNDTFRISAGYVFSGWYNVVKANQFINAVQTDNFTSLSDTLSFDGFVGRAELRF